MYLSVKLSLSEPVRTFLTTAVAKL